MSATNQYLVYAALALGSLGAYGTLTSLEDGSNVSTLSEAMESSELSSAQLVYILEQFSAKISNVEALVKNSNVSTSNESTSNESTSNESTSNESTSNESPSPSSAAEVTDARVTEIETAVDWNAADIMLVDAKARSNLSEMTSITTSLQEQITLNKNTADAYGTTADENKVKIVETIEPKLSDLETDVGNLQDEDARLDGRITALEEADGTFSTTFGIVETTVTSLSGDVTTNLESIQEIERQLTFDINPRFDGLDSAISAVSGDLAFLTSKITPLEDEFVDEVVCNSKFRAEEAEISLANNYLRLGVSSDDTCVLYKEGTSAFLRIQDSSASSFFLENHNEDLLFAVRGDDGSTTVANDLTVAGLSYISTNYSRASFGFKGASYPGFQQDEYGALYINGNTNTYLTMSDKAGGLDSAGTRLRIQPDEVRVYKELTITNQDNLMYNTHFNYNNEGYNWITSGSGCSTKFRFGRGNPTVEIRNKEINIDGTDVLAKLNSLQTQLNNLETGTSTNLTNTLKDYVKLGDNDGQYKITGHNDDWSKYLSYDGNNARWANTLMKVRFHKVSF